MQLQLSPALRFDRPSQTKAKQHKRAKEGIMTDKTLWTISHLHYCPSFQQPKNPGVLKVGRMPYIESSHLVDSQPTTKEGS